jgi:hypothetical protein
MSKDELDELKDAIEGYEGTKLMEYLKKAELPPEALWDVIELLVRAKEEQFDAWCAQHDTSTDLAYRLRKMQEGLHGLRDAVGDVMYNFIEAGLE